MGDKKKGKNKLMMGFSQPVLKEEGENQEQRSAEQIKNSVPVKQWLLIQQYLSTAVQYLCLDNVNLLVCLLSNTLFLFFFQKHHSICIFFYCLPILPVNQTTVGDCEAFYFI